MESLKRARKTRFVLLWGVFGWGGTTALLITLFDWHATHYLKPYFIVGRFVIFMSLGYFFGLSLWNRLEESGRKKMTRAQGIVRSVLFVGLMLGLIYVLWILSHR